MTALLHFALIIAIGFNKVHIGQHDYRIVFTETNFSDGYENGKRLPTEEIAAQFDGDAREVRVRTSFGVKELRRILIHEIQIHGCFYETRLNAHRDKFSEDDVANNLDQCMADVLTNNPQLVKFMQGVE